MSGSAPTTAAGAALLACPVALLLAAAPVGEAAQVAAGALAVLLLAAGLCGLRRVATGVAVPGLLVAVGLTVTLSVVPATLLQVSGVAVTVLVAVAAVVALRRSSWRAGDLSLLGIVLGLDFGIAYVLDNVVHADNGSQTDQAVPPVLLPSLGLAVWVVGRTRWLSRGARAGVLLGGLGVTAAFVTATATGDVGVLTVVLLVAGIALLAVGLVLTGLALLGHRPGRAARPA